MLRWCLALLVATAFAFPEDGAHFAFSNKPGPHPVGLRIVLQYDYSRTYRSKLDAAGHPFNAERARPIQTLIWYPAAHASAHHLAYGDYLALFATEEDFSPDAATVARLLRKAKKEFDADPSVPMSASLDAQPATGTYPLVVYAPSFSAPAFENADLCEYLASYGYLVIASPDMGARTRGMTADLAGINAQARDISFLIGFARSLPQADLGRVGVAGFSWGGISNLFAAALDNRISVLVSLDGSARYYPKLIAESKYVQPAGMTLPLLFFTQSEITLEDINKNKFDISGNVLNQLQHSDVTIVRMRQMRHGDFSSLFQRSPRYWKESQPAEYTPAETAKSYGWMAQYCLRFLDAKLKQEPSAVEFLANAPFKNGVPEHLIKIDVRPAKDSPPTIEGLSAEVGKVGFNHLPEVYAKMKTQNPDLDLALNEDAISGWGSELLKQNHPTEAIAVLKFNVSLRPDSSSVYQSLAEVYEETENRELAVANYAKALEKDPANEEAAARLKLLQSSAAR